MATLKISDLSVGDWVEYEGLHYPITFVGYGEGGDGSLVNLIRPDLSCFTCKISDIHPIPITAEILGKNGISKTYESDEYAVYKGEGFNVTEYYTELWEFEKRRNRLMIRNVHQLQHALRLAGVEKEIEV